MTENLKEYYFEVKLEFGQIITETDQERAKQALKETFLDEYNIVLQDDEITLKSVDDVDEEEASEILITKVMEDGDLLDEYPVDESQTVSNAGDGELYELDGRRYEIITWNENAVEHEPGSQIIKLLAN